MRRRLAAILAADVVGFSRLMGENEPKTIRALKSSIEQVIEPSIKEYDGRLVNIAGDGLLAEFASVVHAVACSIDIQRQFDERECGVDRVDFRIGLNIGEIIESGTDVIHGDCVNIAFRLQALADPGGIVASGAIRDHLGNRLQVEFTPLGDQSLKNIRQKVPAYRLAWWEIGPEVLRQIEQIKVSGESVYGTQTPKSSSSGAVYGDQRRTNFAATTIVLAALCGVVGIGLLMWQPLWKVAKQDDHESHQFETSQPSIAVLPFENLGDNAAYEAFSDGITNDIITDLSRFSGLFVIAANSSFRYKNQHADLQNVGKELGVRYILEGSVQREPDRIRVNAQLIDATTAYHIWADRYERANHELFEVQNEISQSIVGVIGPVAGAQGKLRETEEKRIRSTPTHSLKAYDHYLQGVIHYEKFNKVDNELAKKAFEKALVIDPSYSKALAKLARISLNEYSNHWVVDVERSLERAEELANKAISADPSEPDAHQAFGTIKLSQRKHDLAIQSLEKAVRLNPNGVDNLMWLGWVLCFVGRAEEGLGYFKKGIRRNPFHPGWYLYDLAWSNFVLGRYQDAADALERRNPKSNFTHLLLAASYAKLDRIEDAQVEMAIFRAAEPEYTVAIAAETEPFRGKKDLQHYLDALREAGLPEGKI